jgi:3-isopropylmalate dehydrogenase
MRFRITVLPGDGIGLEVTREAIACLEAIAAKCGHEFELDSRLIGGAALEACGVPLPDDTLAACLASDAVLLGAVGAPKYDANPPKLKPERGLLELRAGLGVYANLRPAFLYDSLVDASPIKPEIVRGTDLLIVRELAGGLYFGQPRGIEEHRAVNTLVYTDAEVERVARVAFELARQRRKKVTSIDKANVLESSQLWRKVVTRVAADYPDVQLEHSYVDSAAMALVTRPTSFDVIVTENLFGDILSDEAAVLTGSLGMLPSASLGGKVALYEPVHGSAPDIAGRDIANPIGAIASAAMLLRHTCKLEREARQLENAIKLTLDQGYGTPDLSSARRKVGTAELGEMIRRHLVA